MTTVSTTDLRNAMALLSRVIERRNTIPVLGNVMLKASGETLTLSGTDLDMEASVAIPCEDTAPWAVTIGARLLSDFLRGCVGPVKITTDAKTITLENDGMKMVVNLICPASDMPVMKFQGTAFGAISEPILRKVLASCAVAISTEETRYYLNGVYLHAKDGYLRGVATDGHRMSMYTTETAWLMSDVILPRKAVAVLLSRLKAASNHEVHIEQDHGVNRTALRFIHPDWTLTTKLIDGKFPDYNRVIPAASDKFGCTLSHAQISRIPDLDRAVKLDPSAGMITATTPHEVAVSVPMQGHGYAVGFNLRYLKDFTRAHGTVSLSGGGAGDPHIVKAEDPAWMGVIMPMRV